jgi:general secretion pathway protein E
MIEPAFNQMQVNHTIGLDFSTAVRALLRQDPDIIMVGEIRDLETAEMAVQSALTGHLVLSTLHTNDAPTAITRLLELGLPPYLIRSTMLGVMAQRLVRILCPHCKEAGDIDDVTWKDLVAPWTVAKPAKIYHPKGCLECRDTGFMGRMGIYEVLPVSHDISNLINESTDHLKLRQQAMKEGMHSLKLSGAQKVAAGLTTIEEVMRVAPMS